MKNNKHTDTDKAELELRVKALRWAQKMALCEIARTALQEDKNKRTRGIGRPMANYREFCWSQYAALYRTEHAICAELGREVEP